MLKPKIKNTSSTYGKFLASQEWNIYGTSTYINPISPKANRRIIERLFNSNECIDKMFFVSEPFISSNHVHCHFLVSCRDESQTLKHLSSRFSRYGKYQINLISESNIFKNNRNELSVCYYVTKSLDKNVDYDFLIK